MGTGVAVNTGDSITAAKMNLKLETVVNADVEAGAAIAWTKIDATGSNITDITTRSHTSLTDIGTNTHAQLDTAVTAANEATDTTCFPLFHTAATGVIAPKTNAALTFNSNTGSLGATTVVANLTGNVTGNCSGSSGSCTGNAATVTGYDPAGGSLTLAGADAITLTTTAATNLTLPEGPGTLVPSNPPALKKKVINIYYDPADGQIKYEVEP